MKADMSNSSKSASSCSDEDAELRRGPWTLEEDGLLVHYIACHGEGRWNLLAKRSGLRRTGKSCRLRWLNYLKPDVKRGNLTPEEQLLILQLHSKWGNRWSKIAQHLPGRTDNEIKNYWRTRVQKQARHLKIDSSSTDFQEVIRTFWIPRLLQKIQGSSPCNPVMLPQNLAAPTDTEAHINYPPPALQVSLTNDLYRKNSSSEHCTSPSTVSSSSESLKISHLPPLANLEYPTSPYDHNKFVNGCYEVEAMSSLSMAAQGGFENLISEFQMGESNWIENQLADNFWNMDESWQLRQLQERAI